MIVAHHCQQASDAAAFDQRVRRQSSAAKARVMMQWGAMLGQGRPPSFRSSAKLAPVPNRRQAACRKVTTAGSAANSGRLSGCMGAHLSA